MSAESRSRTQFEREVLAELRAVHAVARHLTRSRAEAEDLTQETFARAFTAWERYALGTSMRAWLLTILRSAFLRRRRDDQRHPVEELDEAVPAPETPLARANWERVSAQMLDQALAQVPLRYREPVVLRDLQGLSYREVAMVLEVPPGTAMSRLQRGRDALRKALLALLGEPTPEEKPGRRSSRR